MPRKRIPSYRHYKPKNLGLVVIAGKYHYLGKYGTPESLTEYNRRVQEWLVHQHTTPVRDSQLPELTISALLLAFWKHAQEHYRDSDGRPTGELDNLRDALRPVRKLYGHTPAKEFGPLALRAVREDMIQAGLARRVINARICRVRRVFRWAASVELIPVAVVQALETVDGLKRDRCEAPESPGVKPVDWALVEATLPQLPRPVAARVQVMRLSNCRAEDVVIMRGCDLTMKGDIWIYRPATHKNAWREEGSEVHKRVIYLGPQTQENIRPFLKQGSGGVSVLRACLETVRPDEPITVGLFDHDAEGYKKGFQALNANFAVSARDCEVSLQRAGTAGALLLPVVAGREK
jgi:hypothetical protein